MISRSARALPLAACLVLAACGAKIEKEPPSGDPNTVVIDQEGVFLGGLRIGDPPPDTRIKHGPLFDKLKEQREAWEQAHPGQKFPGVLSLELDPNMTCHAAMSVYQTAAFAAYPNLTVKQSAVTLAVPASLPNPPVPGEVDVGIPEVFLLFLPDGNVEIRRLQCGGAYDVVPAAAVTDTVKEYCGQLGDCVRTVHVHCNSAMPFAKVLPALEGLRKASARMELSSVADCKPGGGPTDDSDAGRSAQIVGFFDPRSGHTPAPPPPDAPGKKRINAEVREGALTASGGLTNDEAKDPLKATLPAVTACYETGLAANPNLQGRVSARIEVGKKGAVMRITNGGSDLPDPEVVKCVLKAVGAASFPAKGRLGLINYPLLMAPK